MKKKTIYIILTVSLIINTLLLGVIAFDSFSHKFTSLDSDELVDSLKDMAQRQTIAERVVKKIVCDNLYYPDSYDPVKTTVDSAFYNLMLDSKCLAATEDIIKAKEEYDSAKNTYDENNHEIRFFGGGDDIFLEPMRKNKKEAAKKMNDAKNKIKMSETIIKNRDTSKDGQFIGWAVTHRYRSSNSDGVVSFDDVLYILDPKMKKCNLGLSLNENDNLNINKLREVLVDVLNSQE